MEEGREGGRCVACLHKRVEEEEEEEEEEGGKEEEAPGWARLVPSPRVI